MKELGPKETATFYLMMCNYFEHHKGKIEEHVPYKNIADERLVWLLMRQLEDAVELFKQIVPPDLGLKETEFVESIEEMKRWI